MRIYLEEKDMPEKCRDCCFINGDDECMLQDEDANFAANDSWDEHHRGCPLIPLRDASKPNGMILTKAGESLIRSILKEIMLDKEDEK